MLVLVRNEYAFYGHVLQDRSFLLIHPNQLLFTMKKCQSASLTLPGAGTAISRNIDRIWNLLDAI
jgi:hypothetical protein